MREFIILFFSMIRWSLGLLKPGGSKALVAELLLMKHQVSILNRTQTRAKLTPWDRFLMGLGHYLVHTSRMHKLAIVFRSETYLRFHKALVKKKYSLLFSNKFPKKPGPKGPSAEIVKLVIEIKKKNRRFGYPKIANMVNSVLGTAIDRNVVKRILDKYHWKDSGGGPSWLTVIGNAKDSLFSLDFFRCESASLQTYWVMVVMDPFTRRIIGFAFQKGNLDGPVICRMLNQVLRGERLPKYLSFDRDPLFKYFQWRANLSILEIESIRSVPYVPWSHPFVERLIKSIRNEYLDQVPFSNGIDLERKLKEYKIYFNEARVHSSFDGLTPLIKAGERQTKISRSGNYTWKSYCHGQFQIPVAA